MSAARALVLAGVCAASAAQAQGFVVREATESPRTSMMEFRLGSYLPLIDRERGLTSQPYASTFGPSGMLLFELEADHQLFQQFGSAAVGFSIGYAEKYGKARVLATNTPSLETTSLHVLPLKLMGVYRFDVAAVRWNIPLVPYVKAGFVYIPWWSNKGAARDVASGNRGSGAQYGYVASLGMSLLLDFFEPRMARDFDSSLGVNHSYLFAEYVYQDATRFGRGGLDLSGRYWMFGLALEY